MNTMRTDVVISDWCRWIAQDKNGSWFEYEYKPQACIYSWLPGRGRISLLYKGVPPKDFTKTLWEWR